MKVVLDTNVLISGIFWTGVPYRILEMWIQNKFDLLVSDDILKEYERVLYKISKKKNPTIATYWITLITENSNLVKVRKKFKISADPDDDKFIECAVSGKAVYIVSGDSHLLDLKSILNVSILLPSAFLQGLIGKR